MQTTQHAYLSRLDHLRFFAAALVVLFHYFHTQIGDLRSGNPLISLVDEGHTGIALFMVISGFIFTLIAGNRHIRYAGFLKNRILRIYPLFVFAVFLQLFISTYNDHRNYGLLQLLSWLIPFRSETVPLTPTSSSSGPSGSNSSSTSSSPSSWPSPAAAAAATSGPGLACWC